MGDGVYNIDPDGTGTTYSPFSVYCDMSSTDQLGWTLVMRAKGTASNNSDWATTGALNANPPCSTDPECSSSFKFSDASINAVRGTYNVGYRTISTGTYAYTRYWLPSCTYKHLTPLNSNCHLSYATLNWTGLKTGISGNTAESGLSDDSGNLLYIVAYHNSSAGYYFCAGNGAASNNYQCVITTTKPDFTMWVASYPVMQSCKALKDAYPALGDGTYYIDPDGTGGNAPFQAYCDMTTDGGGWTEFFRGINGGGNYISNYTNAFFECSATYTSSDNLVSLRRLPASVTTSNWFAASCGAKMVKFQIPTSVLNLFKSGTQSDWVSISSTSVIKGTVSYPPNRIYGGSNGCRSATSFILNNSTYVKHFMSTYFNANVGNAHDADFCDGVADTTSTIKLYYK